MAEIENLSITVAASADEAYVAFDRLISKLNRTKIELKAFAAGAVVSALKEIKSNASAAASALNRFANAQERANRAMGGFTGAGYTSTMRGAASDANTATNAITRFVNAMATAQSAMQRMRYANPYGSNRPYAPTQPRLTGEVQEPIETTFVDDNSGDLNGFDHEEPGVQRFNQSMQSLRNTLRSILQPLGDVGKQLGSVFAAGARRAAHSLAGFFSGLLRIAKFRIFRTIVKDLGQSFKDLYGWSNAFGTDFAGSMDKITTAFTYLRNSIAAMTAPLVNALAPALDYIIDKVVDVLNWFNQLFAAIGGQDTYTVAKKVAVSFGDTLTSTSGKAKKAADEIKRTILGFDEINKLVSPKDNSNSSGSGSSPYSKNYKMMFEEKPLSSGFKGFSDAIEKSLNDTLSRIGIIISGASLAVGAILTFSGANVPLGLSMMAAGASGLVSIIGMNWNGLSADIKLAIGAVEAVIGGSLLAIGGILAFSGVKPALGIAMMAAGAVSLASAVGLNWDLITGKVSASVKGVAGALSAATAVVGAILTFTGVNAPLGIALMATGITGAAVTLNWDYVADKLRGPIGTATAIVSGASLVLGILALIGGAVPLGIGLILAGSAGLASTVSANWDNMKKLGAEAVKQVKEGWNSVKDKVVEFVAKVRNDAKTWWSNVKTWWAEKFSAVKDFVVKVANDASTWWKNVKSWWAEKVGSVESFITNVKNNASIWWNNVKTWWKSKVGAVQEFYTNVKNNASAWWQNAKSWWASKVGAVQDFTTNVSNTASKWWGDVVSWWDGVVNSTSIKSVSIGILNTVREWWNSIVDWWDNFTTGKWLGIQIGIGKGSGKVDTSAASAYDSSAWEYAQQFAKNTSAQIQNGLNNNPVSVTVNATPGTNMGYGSSWWGGSGLTPNVSNTDASATINAVAGSNMSGGNWWSGGSLYPVVGDTTSTAYVDVSTPWSWWEGIRGYLGLNNLDATAWVDVDTPWWYWGRSLLSWLGMDNLSTTVTVNAVAGSGGGGGGAVNLMATKAKGGIFSRGTWSDIPQYASGRAGVNHGSLFWAGENGAEIVGNAGGRTEVLNRSQIASAMYSAVQAAMAPAAANFASAAESMGSVSIGFDIETLAEMVRQGVEQAMSRSNDLDRQRNEYLRQINDKDFTAEVTSNDINNAQRRMNRRAGTTVVAVG